MVESENRDAGKRHRGCGGDCAHPLRQRRRCERARHPAGAARVLHGGARGSARRRSDRGGRRAQRARPAGLCRDDRDRTFHGLHHRRRARCHSVCDLVGCAAGGESAAGKRGAGTAAGGRPGRPRAALAVHRPALAREHPGGRLAGSHPAHQRICGRDSRRRARLPGCVTR